MDSKLRPQAGTNVRHALLLVLALVALLIDACVTPQASPSAPSQAAAVATVGLVPADYFAVTWADEDTLVLGWMPPSLADGRSQGSRLVAADLDASEHRALPHATANERCDFIEERWPSRIDDGRVAFIRDCLDYGTGAVITEITALDLDSEDEVVLASLSEVWLPDGRALVGSFSFRAGTTDGLLGMGDVLCGSVATFDSSEVHPLDFPLPSPARGDLADVFARPCAETVNAFAPAWSPDGTRIAVLIAPDARGVDGFGRFDAAYDIAVLDPATRTLEWFPVQLDGAYRLAWSPDGTILLVIANPPAGSEIWLVPIDGSQPYRLLFEDTERVSEISWSPDGRHLAALVVTSADLDLDRLVQPVLVSLP